MEILRGNETVVRRRRETPGAFATTWVTASELFYGAARSMAPDENWRLAARFLATLPILGLDVAAAERFGALRSFPSTRLEPDALMGCWLE